MLHSEASRGDPDTYEIYAGAVTDEGKSSENSRREGTVGGVVTR